MAHNTIQTEYAHPALARLLSAVAHDLPFLLVLAAAISIPETRQFALINAGVQFTLFIAVACIPAYRTGVMAMVDVAWPWGLVAIGVQTLLLGDPHAPATVVVAIMYLIIGARMGLWAVRVVITDFPRNDLPRYRFQRLRWERMGYRGTNVPMQHEILQQGLANTSALALPAALVIADPGAATGGWLVAGLGIWAVSWALESLADLQKSRFIRAAAEGGRTCDVGMWRYSRHPNYFFQWIQWHGLILIAAPVLWHLRHSVATIPWVILAAGVLAISAAMAYTLVYYTGAVPAEHFSVRHRPSYREYQRTVNRFVPGPRRVAGR